MPGVPVLNVHSRIIDADVDDLGATIDALAGPDDRLWPVQDWMPLRIRRPIEVGSPGGHGFATYEVVGYQPGRWVRFELTSMPGLGGFHEFLVTPLGRGQARLQHVLVLRIAFWLVPLYPLVVKPVHDNVLRMILDRAEVEMTGRLRNEPATLTPWTKMLKPLLGWASRLVLQADTRMGPESAHPHAHPVPRC